MSNEEFKVEITRNILEGKTCDNCNNGLYCKYKSKKRYNTCRKWTQQFELKITSIPFRASPKKLRVTWNKVSELELQQSFDTESELAKLAIDEIKKDE